MGVVMFGDELSGIAARLGVSVCDVATVLALAFPGKHSQQRSIVERICAAYEDGYAHGLDTDDAINPYAEGLPESSAWRIGYVEGERRFNSPNLP